MVRRAQILFGLTVVLWLHAGPIDAQLRPTKRFVKLTHEADAIAVATCESAVSMWDEHHRFILTRSTVHIGRRFKGAPEETITVQTLGGKVGDLSMVASHGARLRAGEPAVLFLRRSQYRSYYVVWGGEDGKLPVQQSPSGLVVVGTGGPVDLDGFAALVDDAAQQP